MSLLTPGVKAGMTDGHKITVQTPGKAVQYRSSRGFEWTQLELPVRDLPHALDGLRIIHLADFHCRPQWDPAYDELISRLRQHPPDLILFSGDFVESKIDARPALPVMRKLLTQLPSRLGMFAVLGNHDGDLVTLPVAACGVTLLNHRRVLLSSPQAAVELIGLPGVDRLDLDMSWVRGLPPRAPRVPRIVLCHYPDILPKIILLKPDIYLAGHTHGGQIAWPNGVPILRHDSLPHRLCSGIHSAFGTVLVSNRGFGFSSPLALRLFCPAQVIEITARREIEK